MNKTVHPGPVHRILDIAPVILVLAAAVLLLGWTLALWSRLHPDLPWRDIFVILDDLRPTLAPGAQLDDWLFLWDAHYNAHRIAVTRILTALDIRYFHGHNHLLFATGWLAILAILAVYLRGAKNYFDGERSSAWFYCGAAVVVMFAPAHSWNLMNPINSQWHVAFALALLAFSLLIKREGTPTRGAWVAAYLLVLLSALNSFSGVIGWLLLPALALWGSRQGFIAAVVASLACTGLYIYGLSSDADMAVAWQVGDPAIAAQIREAGQAAIAANNPLRMIARAAGLLSWPLSEDRPALGLVLVALSLVPLALYGYRFVSSLRPGHPRLHPWLQLSLFGATFALGVALSVQLGRVMEQPNYAHGPSYERYNTIVACYWLGVLGLLLGLKRELPPRWRPALPLAILLALWLLLVPRGHYLKQEVESLQTAAKLYAGGENPALREPLNLKLLRFKPEYVYSFDALFSERALAYKDPEPLAGDQDRPRPCAPGLVQLTASPSSRAGFVKVRGTLAWPWHLISRDIIVASQGQLAARLYPIHEGDYSPADLMRGSRNHWYGDIDEQTAALDSLRVKLNLPGGLSIYCKPAPFSPGHPGPGDQPDV